MFIYFRLLFFVISAVIIFIFHRKTIIYNKEQENSPIWWHKESWPYRILRAIWSISRLLLILSQFNFRKFPNIHSWKNDSKIITKNDDEKNNTKPIYREIISQKRQEELIWNKNAIINPIISWYYELITEDKKLIRWEWIIEWDYIIPQPINISYCKDEDKYRNLWSFEWLNYNWLIYEYLNANKKKDIVIWVRDIILLVNCTIRSLITPPCLSIISWFRQ
jgi:hypothetical protein